MNVSVAAVRAFVATSIAMLIVTLGGCNAPPGASQTAAPGPQNTPTGQLDEPADPSFIGRVWISTTPGSARGTIMVFLPDRSLLIDSCFETFRLSKWGVAGDHIRWIEDTIPIEAKVTMLGKNEMRLDIPDHPQSFVAAQVPYKCPDMPR